MKRYEKYKPTDIQWLPEIPEHWVVQRFGSLFKLKTVTNDTSKELLSVFLDRGVIKASESDKRTHQASEDLSKYQLVEPTDFVMNNQQAWRGSVGVSSFIGIISPAYHIFPMPNCYNSHYANYLLRDRIMVNLYEVSSKGVGSIQRTLNFNWLNNGKCILPSIDEQNKIVAYLDKRITLIENCKCQRERELQTLNELKQAEIASVVTRGLNPNVPMKDSCIPWIGQIPVHWDMKYLFQVAHEHYISNKDIHHQNLLSLSYGKIVHKDINTTEGLLPASFDTYQIIEPGNIVFRFTDLQNDHKSLRVGLSKETGIITSAYIAVEVDTIYILPEYFYYILHSFDIKKLFYSMGGGLRQSLNYNGIRKLYLPIPPLEEQKAIVSFIDNKIKKIEVMIQSLESEIDRLTEYKQRLISDVVTGQIDVRGEQI